MTAEDGMLRIGELSRRTGVSPELLRAWEHRYGLLRPARSAGRLRLYSRADLDRVQLMRRHLDEGLAAAEAAAAALREEAVVHVGAAPAAPASTRRELGASIEAFDEPGAQLLLDRLLATTTVDTLLGEIVLPYLHDLGERWARGQVSVAQEHFASGLLRGRLLGLARGWGLGVGPQALLACLPGEQHDIGLIAFGLALRARGWRIVLLGADAPLVAVAAAADELDPALVVLSGAAPERATPHLEQLRDLAGRHRVAVGGAVTEGLAGTAGIELLAGDALAAAAAVAQPA
jgi:DNA-binding transcriptional MerR regulator